MSSRRSTRFDALPPPRCAAPTPPPRAPAGRPEVPTDALAELMRRYAVGAPTADRLVERLADFLRVAMPGPRHGTSTLAAELALARAYMRLREELYPAQGAWRITVADELGDLPFPPLRLVELVDRWTHRYPDDVDCVMTIARDGGGARVELHVDAPAEDGPATPAGAPQFSLTFDASPLRLRLFRKA